MRRWPWTVHHQGQECSRRFSLTDGAAAVPSAHDEALCSAEGLSSCFREWASEDPLGSLHGVDERVATPAEGESPSPAPGETPAPAPPESPSPAAGGMDAILPTGQALRVTAQGGSQAAGASSAHAVLSPSGAERSATRTGERGSRRLASTASVCGPGLRSLLAERQARRRFTDLDRLAFFDHLAIMLTVGIPLSRALAALATQCGGGGAQGVCEGVLAGLRAGDSLSLAMNRLGGTFSSLEIGVVQAGEACGGLPLVLGKLAACQERRMTRSRQVLAAVTYPLVVFALALLLLGGVAHVVSRGILPVLEEAGTEVGLGTRLLFALLALPTHPVECLLLGGLLAGGAFFIRSRLQTLEGRRLVDRWILRVPLLGNAVRCVEVARVCDSLALLCEAGLPLIHCLESARRGCSNSQAADSLACAVRAVTNGESLSRGLDRGGFFPRVVVQLTAVGEESGRLGDMLHRVAQYSDLEGRAALDRLQASLEPLMVLGIGLVVGLVVLGVLTPLYQAIATLA